MHDVPVEDLRARVATACRHVAAGGLVLGTAGNVSARDGDRVAISARGLALAEADPDSISIVDLNWGHVEGDLEPTSELDLHLGVYRKVDSEAVVHTHPPFASALSCVLDAVPYVHYSMLLLGGEVPVVPYATFGTPELADAVIEVLEDRAAALMANHGAIVHAADLDTAVQLSLLLEWVCALYWRANAMGEPQELSETHREDLAEQASRLGYGTTQQRADEPDGHAPASGD